MALVEVVNWDKKKVGEIELPANIFEVPLKKEILQEVVKWQLACRRQGTHSTKTKGLVRGGGKKPYKQKGTGNARRGSSRSPLIRGGGIIFGPQPRDYSYKLPKKVRQQAVRVALSHLLRSGKLFVVDGFESKEGKTGELAKRLARLGLAKSVLVDREEQPLLKRAARNLEGYRYYGVTGINVFDLLKYDGAIVAKESIEGIARRCGMGD